MLPFHRILVTTDFSDTSLTAIPAAVELASHFDAEIVLVHILPVDAPTPWDIPPYADFGLASSPLPEYERQVRDEVERRLAQVAAQNAPNGVKLRAVVGRGDPAAEVGRIAQTEKIDLIVLATHGWTGWRHLVFGSVAEKILREAPCPVLSVRKSPPVA
ncbi:MAG TPA: universal stress protein [Candidatus Polarisedimenticolaceae bacterium]|nr:universal stress protein [Candidatus Polarisedimenticolaceae bacterium]